MLELRAVPPLLNVADKPGSRDQVTLARHLPHLDDKPVCYEIRYLCNDYYSGILGENLEVESSHEILVFKQTCC